MENPHLLFTTVSENPLGYCHGPAVRKVLPTEPQRLPENTAGGAWAEQAAGNPLG